MRGLPVRKPFVAIIVALSLNLGAGAARADTLSAAMRDAYLNSDLLEQTRYLLRLSDEGVAQQLSGLRPVISFVAQSQWTSATGMASETVSHTVGLTADLLLYNGGAQRLAVDAAEESVLATRQGLIGLEQSVLRDAVTAYMQVWRDIQVVGVSESNVRVIMQQVRAARDRFEVGEDTRTDVALAEAQLATARSNLAGAQGQLEISRELFQLAVGRAPGGLVGPGGLPNVPGAQSEADAIARQNHPSILALQHEVRANEINLDAARANYGPTISLRAETGAAIDNLGDPSSRLTLSLTQPIYSGGQLASLERVALATLLASRSELNQQVRVTLQGVGNAYAQLRIASAQILASDQRIRAAQLAFDGVREEASLGARTTLDVLDAEQDLLDARISRIEAQTSAYLASYGVLASMGLLTVEHLDLDVPEFDPTGYYNTVRTAPGRSVQGARLDSVMDRFGRN